MKTKIKKHSKHNFDDLFLHGYSYDNWFDKPNDNELNDLLDSDEKVTVTPPLEGEENIEEKLIKILTPNKLVTRLPVLLA